MELQWTVTPVSKELRSSHHKAKLSGEVYVHCYSDCVADVNAHVLCVSTGFIATVKKVLASVQVLRVGAAAVEKATFAELYSIRAELMPLFL